MFHEPRPAAAPPAIANLSFVVPPEAPENATANLHGFAVLAAARWRPTPRQWLIAATAVVLPLLGIVLYLDTDNGTVKIELSDPKANAVVKVDGKPITEQGLGEPLKVRVGEHQLEVSGDGFETHGESFIVRRGENTLVHVQLVPKVSDSTSETVRTLPSTSEASSTDLGSEYEQFHQNSSPLGRARSS